MGKTHKNNVAGAAALEVLMLMPFIILIMMLIITMAYNGYRHRQTQQALRLGAYEFVTGLATSNRSQSLSAAQSTVNSTIFAGEKNAAKLSSSSTTGVPPDVQAGVSDPDNLLSKVSSRETVAVEVKRTPPFASLVSASPQQLGLVVSSNTWTYCEMKDKDQGVPVMKELDKIGKYGLWLFGGCGGTGFLKCEDKCPK